MKTLAKLLPALALVLGATLAVAMNFANPSGFDSSLKVWTPDPDPIYQVTNGYREITQEVQEVDFECNSGGQECRVQFDNDDPMTGVKNVLSTGIYAPL